MDRRTVLSMMMGGLFSAGTVALAQRVGWLESTAQADLIHQRERFELAARKDATIEGEIQDRYNNAMTTAAEAGRPAQVTDAAFGSLVGYRTTNTCSGLRRLYQQDLFCARRKGGGKAPALITSIDSELQIFAYSLLEGLGRSCICAANAATGEVLALASRHGEEDLDVNQFSARFEHYKTMESGFLAEPWRGALPIGSTAKIMTLLAMLHADIPLDWTDKTGIYKDIHNANKTAGGVMNEASAAVASSNTYFAHGADAAGFDHMTWAQEYLGMNSGRFCFESVPLKASGLNTDSSNAEVLQQAIGQGTLQASCLVPMVQFGCLASGRLVNRLFTAKKLEDTLPDGTVETEWLNEEPDILVRDAVEMDRLRSVFAQVAKAYKLTLAAEGAEVFAKTGTAQLSNGRYATYLPFSIRYKDGHSYMAIVFRENCQETSSALKPAARELLAKMNALHSRWEK